MKTTGLILAVPMLAMVGGLAGRAEALQKSNTAGYFKEVITYTNIGGANPISISDWRSEITFVNSGCGAHVLKVNGGTQFTTANLCPTGGTVSIAGAHPSSSYASGNVYTNHWSSTSGWSPGTGNATVSI